MADEPEVLGEIRRRHTLDLTWQGRYPGGESDEGSHLVVDSESERYVLEWRDDPTDVELFATADATTDTLRHSGYPAPHYVAVGAASAGAYGLREELPGHPLGEVTAAWVGSLIALNDMQAGRGVSTSERWPNPAVLPVLYGGTGFCLLDTMRSYSQDTADLLDICQDLAAAAVDLDLPRGDIVHFDFTPANVLVEGDRITGVVDWAATCSGDRGFDLATILFYGYADRTVRDHLWTKALQVTSYEAMGVYLAHIMHRQVEWSTRNHDRTRVEHYLSLASAVVDDVLG